MPAGRPTKYTKALLEKAKDYVKNYAEHDHAFPSDIGLARVLDIGTTTLYEWAKDEEKKEFRDTLDKINIDQQLVAWQKGLKGEYNANLVKLLLASHGHHDKQDNTHSGPTGGPIEHSVIEFVGCEDRDSGED